MVQGDFPEGTAEWEEVLRAPAAHGVSSNIFLTRKHDFVKVWFGSSEIVTIDDDCLSESLSRISQRQENFGQSRLSLFLIVWPHRVVVVSILKLSKRLLLQKS